MSTRALIGILDREANKVTANICHYDGYPANMLPKLRSYYVTLNKVESLVQGNALESFNRLPPIRKTFSGKQVIDLDNYKLPYWCEYLYIFLPNRNEWVFTTPASPVFMSAAVAQP